MGLFNKVWISAPPTAKVAPTTSAIKAIGKRKLCTILSVILSTSPIPNNAFTTSDTDSIAGPVITSRIRLTTPIARKDKITNQRLRSSLRWLATISATTELFFIN